jgi:hypothetical protein
MTTTRAVTSDATRVEFSEVQLGQKLPNVAKNGV